MCAFRRNEIEHPAHKANVWCCQLKYQNPPRALTWKKLLPSEHLCEDAADGPDVDGRRVLDDGHHELRRAVPARRHVLRHEHLVRLRVLVDAPRHTCTEEQISRARQAASIVCELRCTRDWHYHHEDCFVGQSLGSLNSDVSLSNFKRHFKRQKSLSHVWIFSYVLP